MSMSIKRFCDVVEDYRALTDKTAKYPLDRELEYLVLGLTSEAGEVADKVKKHLRDHTPLRDEAMLAELGDCLWYLDRLAAFFGYHLDEVMEANMEKLEDRLQRNVISGSGDDR